MNRSRWERENERGLKTNTAERLKSGQVHSVYAKPVSGIAIRTYERKPLDLLLDGNGLVALLLPIREAESDFAKCPDSAQVGRAKEPYC
jgi:hypothetical protein